MDAPIAKLTRDSPGDMGVGAGLYMCDVVKKFTFAISSPDEFLSNRVVNTTWNSLPNWVVSEHY